MSDTPTTLETPAPVTLRDKRTFDAARFRANADGSPFLNKRGMFMPHPSLGGRRKKIGGDANAETAGQHGQGESVSTTEPVKPADSASPASHPAPEPKPDFSDVARIVGSGGGSAPSGGAPVPDAKPAAPSNDVSVEAALRAVYSVAGAVTDAPDEWQPDSAAEHDGLKGAIVAWMDATQRRFPVLWAFLAALAGFVLKRIRRPRTAAWLAKGKKNKPVEILVAPVPESAPAAPARVIDPMHTPAVVAPGANVPASDTP